MPAAASKQVQTACTSAITGLQKWVRIDLLWGKSPFAQTQILTSTIITVGRVHRQLSSGPDEYFLLTFDLNKPWCINSKGKDKSKVLPRTGHEGPVY